VVCWVGCPEAEIVRKSIHHARSYQLAERRQQNLVGKFQPSTAVQLRRGQRHVSDYGQSIYLILPSSAQEYDSLVPESCEDAGPFLLEVRFLSQAEQ